MLIDAGADINAVNEVAMQLECLCSPSSFQKPQSNWTALHFAAQDCHVSIVELLVNSGADADAGNQVCS